MTDKQSKAQRLADALDAGENFYAESSMWFDRKLADAAGEAADELRRLHASEAELIQKNHNLLLLAGEEHDEAERLRHQCKELLEALVAASVALRTGHNSLIAVEKTCAAIAKHGETK